MSQLLEIRKNITYVKKKPDAIVTQMANMTRIIPKLRMQTLVLSEKWPLPLSVGYKLATNGLCYEQFATKKRE